MKGGLYFVVPLQTLPLWACVLNGVIGLVVFGALGFGLLYFMRRLDRYEPQEVIYPVGGADRVRFKWEYLPLTGIMVVLLFGEMLFNLLVRRGS